jgi:hypothetical protein
MPPLDNQRHERFAQELAKGKTADEAYTAAGYKPNRGNAATLKANKSVLARAAELKERAAVRAEISVASITANLERIASKAEKLDGAPGLAVARAAWMDAAKLNGLVIDRAEQVNVNYDVADEPISPDEWQAGHVTEH